MIPATNHAEITTPETDALIESTRGDIYLESQRAHALALSLEKRLHQATAQLAALEECNRGLREAMQLDQVWSLPSTLEKLCQAVRHLRDVHNCDGHGHEEFYHALAAGERMSVGLAAALAQTPASVSDDLAALRKDKERLDHIETHLIGMSRNIAPDMGGSRFSGQFRNQAKERGEAGPSYLLFRGRDIRDLADAARTQEKHP